MRNKKRGKKKGERGSEWRNKNLKVRGDCEERKKEKGMKRKKERMNEEIGKRMKERIKTWVEEITKREEEIRERRKRLGREKD